MQITAQGKLFLYGYIYGEAKVVEKNIDTFDNFKLYF
ncbi:hypothetical protein HNQ42_000720 [Rummeliibacillus stabekisii]|nr:hypothetical protein [Rummeliibacillus stabekisii]